MKVIKRFDDLGRIAIPKEFRMMIFGTTDTVSKEMEITCNDDGAIVLKPRVCETVKPDYEKMWNELKEKLKKDIAFHESGIGQSIDESINCKAKCKAILDYMNNLDRFEYMEYVLRFYEDSAEHSRKYQKLLEKE